MLIFALMIAASAWIISPWFRLGSYSVQERVGAAQWLVAVGGFSLTFGGVLLAAWQLYLGQRRPDLRPILYSQRGLQHGDRIAVTLESESEFPFKVLLRNDGPVPATDVLVTLHLYLNPCLEPSGPSQWNVGIRLALNSPYRDLWHVDTLEDGLIRTSRLTFRGENRYVSPPRENADPIGSFQIFLGNGGTPRAEVLYARCEVRAWGMASEGREFFFELTPA